MMSKSNNTGRTELSEIGEFGLIDRLTSRIKIHQESTVKGVGDDAAVIDYRNKKTLVSSDLLVEGVHFDLTYYPLKHLGYKSAIVNFSDIVAMNALPRQIIVNIGLSNRFSLEAVEEIYNGMLLACNNYNVDLVGGDTTSSRVGLIISITALGDALAEDIVYRNTAKKGDLVCVTGDLGSAYVGLLLLEREKKVYHANPDMQPDLEGHDYILQRQLKPEARTDIIKLFKELKMKPTAMIDISDGLASEILHICKGSNLGCQIYENKLPIDPSAMNMAHTFSINPVTCVMNGGEDYELLFCIDPEDYPKIRDSQDITVIGHITPDPGSINLISNDDKQIPITAQGWDAFRSEDQSTE